MNILHFLGGLAFGAVVGWATYFVLRRAQPKTLSDLSTFIGVLGGGTITALFDPKGVSFAGYAIGLAIGFFVYYVVFLGIVGKHAIRESLVIKKGSEKPGGAADMGIMGQPSSRATGVPGEVTEEVSWGEDRNKR